MESIIKNGLAKKYAVQTTSCKQFEEANKKEAWTKRLLFVAFGGLIGVVNGLFGAGGGMLAVPLLLAVGGLSEVNAHATAILVILPLCLVSAVVYFASGTLDFWLLFCASIGVFAGGIIGSKMLKRLPEFALFFAFCFVMLVAGLKMLF